jgi:hypothetical protein
VEAREKSNIKGFEQAVYSNPINGERDKARVD